ncbi:glycosyltransferase [Arsenicicoccus dermatophilus]|uniref:glycosyltransferase n=1 Tax=Arsenicicoccus dermatophilus TaxID=1076331 RepID=UPI001F4C9CC5|nr:glycosyltransferase [Arsenicicoccus dermatophilus]MCH8611647.1 glycosyltransferase [Arsenicicoccus dermatophilus]
MKILVVCLNYAPEPSGTAPYTAGLAQGLLAEGHQVRVITGIPHYPQWTNYTGFTGRRRDEIVDGVPVTRLWHTIPSTSGGPGLGRAVMELTFGIHSVLVGWGRPDVVLTVSPALISSGLAMARVRLTPARPRGAVWVQDMYSTGLNELGGKAKLAARAFTLLERGVLGLADGVSVIHERFRRYVVDQVGVDPARVAVNRNWAHLRTDPHGVDVAQMRTQLTGDGDCPIALHAGNMGAKQGLENVVEAAREAERRGSDVIFVLVGDGNQRSRLEELGRGCANLRFAPALPDGEFRAALEAADVLLVNEKAGVKEMAVPSKLTSYFRVGRPVVAATSVEGSCADEVTAAGAGPIIPAGDPALLLETVESVVADPDRAAEHGRSAAAFAAANLAADAAIAGFSRWLQGLTIGGRHHITSLLRPRSS